MPAIYSFVFVFMLCTFLVFYFCAASHGVIKNDDIPLQQPNIWEKMLNIICKLTYYDLLRLFSIQHFTAVNSQSWIYRVHCNATNTLL